MRLIDLTGEKFGRLTVIERAKDIIYPSGQKTTAWYCKCECGNVITASGSDLKRGNIKSCKCLQAEINSLVHKKYNDYKLCNDYVIMYTSKGEEFYVDLSDFEKVKDVCWFKDSHGYLVGYRNGDYLTLHRVIMDCDEHMKVDRKGGFATIHDNRKQNLRIATSSQNSMNRKLQSNNKSGATGVNWDKTQNKWRVQIGINGKRKHLGMFDNFDDAVKARKEAEDKYFGEWSYDNSRLQQAVG